MSAPTVKPAPDPWDTYHTARAATDAALAALVAAR